jgi:chromate transporter
LSIYLKVFFIFLKIGTFAFGGGNAILPFISQEVVTNNHWIDAKEFTDLIAISQATPGPIAINAATYVGYRVSGFLGSIYATLGIVLPTFIIMLIFTKFFLKFKDNKYVKNAFKGLIPATVGLVAAAAVLVSYDSFIDYKSILIFAAAFIASYKYNFDPILLTITAGVIGLLVYK